MVEPQGACDRDGEPEEQREDRNGAKVHGVEQCGQDHGQRVAQHYGQRAAVDYVPWHLLRTLFN